MDENDLSRIVDAYVAYELGEKDEQFIESLAESVGGLRELDARTLSRAQRNWLLDILDRLDAQV